MTLLKKHIKYLKEELGQICGHCAFRGKTGKA